MAPTPRIPPELTRGPFTVEEARRHGVSRSQLLGASWRRLGRGFYAWHEIAEAPMMRLNAAKLRLPDVAVFTGPQLPGFMVSTSHHAARSRPRCPVQAALRGSL